MYQSFYEQQALKLKDSFKLQFSSWYSCFSSEFESGSEFRILYDSVLEGLDDIQHCESFFVWNAFIDAYGRSVSQLYSMLPLYYK